AGSGFQALVEMLPSLGEIAPPDGLLGLPEVPVRPERRAGEVEAQADNQQQHHGQQAEHKVGPPVAQALAGTRDHDRAPPEAGAIGPLGPLWIGRPVQAAGRGVPLPLGRAARPFSPTSLPGRGQKSERLNWRWDGWRPGRTPTTSTWRTTAATLANAR